MKEINKFIVMRTIKTLIAVYVYILVGFVRDVLPFYSAISAVLCIKKEKEDGHAVGLIPVIYINVSLNLKEAVFISCVVFLSVTITHGAEANPYMFAINRMINTIQGVWIAWFVNYLLPMEA